MSLIDFNQEARNQGLLHIAVKDLGRTQGEESDAFFDAVLQALYRLPPIQLSEPKGTVLFLKFLSSEDLPPWASGTHKWSDFNPHKQILGVLGVCRCCDLDDLDNMVAGFKAYSAQYQSSLCESRCIIYGTKSELEKGNIDPKKGYCLIDSEPKSEDIKVESLSEFVKNFALTIYFSLKSRINQLEDSLAKGSSIQAIHSPFEAKEYSRPDDEPELRLTNTHIKARIEKHIADLSLMMGDLQMAFHWYSRALQLMKSSQRDNLWYASANEGLAVTAIIMKLCEEVLGQKAQGLTFLNQGLTRKSTTRSSRGAGSSNSNLTPRSNALVDSRRQPSSVADVAQPKYSTLPRPVRGGESNNVEKQNGGLVFRNSGVDGPPGVVLSDEEGSVADGEEEEDDDSGLQVHEALLHKDFITNKFTVAFKFYEKAKHIGTVSLLEALLKFSKYLIDQKRYRLASDQLQRTLRIAEASSIADTDKLQLEITMAAIYQRMGFHRKAALYTHHAACCTSDLAKSFELDVKAFNLIASILPAFKLSQHLSELPKDEKHYSGWPLIQAKVLKDFVFLSRRKRENELAISHGCYLLRYLSKYLSTGDIKDITKMMTEIVEESNEHAQQNSLGNPIKKIQSPLPLDNIPCVKSVCLVELVDLLKPIKIKGFMSSKCKESLVKMSEGSPFIFSPFEARRQRKNQRPEILWVVGNPGEIVLMVENTLPLDLRVTNMLILTEGAKVDIYPTSLTLPMESEPQDIKLLTVPTESGLLDVKGYKAIVFDIHHECKVKIQGDYIVRVVPPLPEVRLSVLPASEDTPLSPGRDGNLRVGRSAITKFELLDGEMSNYEFQLECLAKAGIDVEHLTLSVADYNKDYCEISWEDSSLRALLPIPCGSQRSFIVSMRAKTPAWFRVLNEHTQGISKTTIFPNLKQEPSTGDSMNHSFSANTTPNISPTSSPKRSPRAQRSSVKSKSSQDYSFSLKSNLMDSLNLDHPALTQVRTSSSLPAVRRSPGHQRNTSVGGGSFRRKRGLRRGVQEMEPDMFDLKRASMMSTHSDPGDSDRKSRFKKGSDPTKSIPIQKLVEPRSTYSPISNSPHTYTESSVLSSFQNSSLSRTGSGNKGPRKQQIPLTKGLISVPMGPLIREKPQAPSRTNLEGDFTIQYSGGGGYLEGYCRQCFIKLPIVVMPCLVFENFEVLSSERSREIFNLKFLIHNTTKCRMAISVVIDQDYDGDNDKNTISPTLDPNGRSEMCVALKRFIVNSNEIGYSLPQTDVAKLYSEKVGEIIKVHWKDLENNKVGMVLLDGLRLPTSTVSLMRPIPLIFSFAIDGQALSQGSYSQECAVGAQVSLTVTLINSSGVHMPASFLYFEPSFLSQQQKRFLKDISHLLLHSGSLVVSVPELEPHKSYEHKMTFVFLLSGKYHMEIKNCMQLQGTHSLQVKLPLGALTPQVEATAATTELNKNKSIQTAELSLTSKTESSPNLNNCSPPLSVYSDNIVPPPLSPRPLSPPPQPSVSSPDSPSNKALQMAKLYEAKMAARDATVYRDSTSKAGKRKTSVAEGSSVLDVSIKKSQSSPESQKSCPMAQKSVSLDASTVVKNSPLFQQKQRFHIDIDNMNTLLSESLSSNSLLKPIQVSPVAEARTQNPTPPPLPKGYHGRITTVNNDAKKVVSNPKQDHCSRFQKLLRLRTKDPKSVRVISGPQITFSVS